MDWKAKTKKKREAEGTLVVLAASTPESVSQRGQSRTAIRLVSTSVCLSVCLSPLSVPYGLVRHVWAVCSQRAQGS
ncbi:unnamed protein product [Nezara viridula]|nr:unnamed protein product [Nezara viridula]